MGLMTGGAAIDAQRCMLENEWPGLIRVTALTAVAGNDLQTILRLRRIRVRVMAVQARNTPLQHRMVIGLAESGLSRLMAADTEVNTFFHAEQPKIGFLGMNVMAVDTGELIPPVRRTREVLNLAFAQSVTAQATGHHPVRGSARETERQIPAGFHMEAARAVASFTFGLAVS